MSKEKIFNISFIHQQYWKEFCDVCYSRFGFEDGEERTYEQKYETFCRCKGYITEDSDYELELLRVRESDLQRVKRLSEWFFAVDDGKDVLPALYNLVRMMWAVGRNLKDDALLFKYICPRKPKVNYASYRLDTTKRLDKTIRNNSTLREVVQYKTDAAILEEILGDELYYRLESWVDENSDTIEWNPADGTIIPVVNQILEEQVHYFNDKLDDFIDVLPSGTECQCGSELQAFLYRLFMSYEDSLSEVKEELEELPTPMNLEELQEESSHLIKVFMKSPLGERWAKCIVCEGGLKHFANYFMHHRKDFTEEDEHWFFYTLDKVCIIEDVLNGKADKYWLEVKYPEGWLENRGEEQTALSPQELMLSNINKDQSKATTIVDAIQQQTAAIDRQTEALKEVASKPTSITANSVSISNSSLQKQDLNFQNTVGQVVAHADKIETSKEDK